MALILSQVLERQRENLALLLLSPCTRILMGMGSLVCRRLSVPDLGQMSPRSQQRTDNTVQVGEDDGLQWEP